MELWNELDGNANVFVAVQRRTQVEVLEVARHEAAIVVGDNAVDQDLDCCHVGGFCARVAWVIDSVASEREAEPSWIGFFWSISAHAAHVCRGAALRHFVGMYKVDGIGSGGHGACRT